MYIGLCTEVYVHRSMRFCHTVRNYLYVLNIIIIDLFLIIYFSNLLFSYLSKLLFSSLRVILMAITETLNQISLF